MMQLSKNISTVGVILLLVNIAVATVHRSPDAKISSTAIIDPTVSYAENVTVLDNARISEYCYLWKSSIIKDGAQLDDRVSVGEFTIVDENVRLGYIPVKQGELKRDIPIKLVNYPRKRFETIVGNNVHIKRDSWINTLVRISSSTSIGIKTFVDSRTTIGKGVTIGNYVRIGANLKIGSGAIIGSSAYIRTDIPSNKNIGENQIAISPPTSEILLKALTDYNYDENTMTAALSDDKFDEYMLKGLKNALKIAVQRCPKPYERFNFDEFKFLIAAYLRKRMNISAKQLQTYIEGEKFPELNESHFGKYDHNQETIKKKNIRAFRTAWVIYNEVNYRLTENLTLPFRNYCDKVNSIILQTSEIIMMDTGDKLFVFP